MTQLRDRFCSDSVTIAVKVQTLLLESAITEEPDSLIEDVVQFYDGDFDAPLSHVTSEFQVFCRAQQYPKCRLHCQGIS